MGSQVTRLALPLTAILTLRAGAAQVTVLNALLTAPFPLFGLLVGVLVDRRSRQRILIHADVGRAFLLASITVAAATGILTIRWLYVVAFAVGTLTVFFDIAYQSFLPSIVTRSALTGANSRLAVSDTLSRVAGPGVGGPLIQLVTAPIAILADAASFLVSATLLGGTPRDRRVGGDRMQQFMTPSVRQSTWAIWSSWAAACQEGSTPAGSP